MWSFWYKVLSVTVHISVIIPTFNRIQLLPRAIESVFTQASNPLIDAVEVIVVDDGSEDGTSDMIATDYPSVQLIEQSNQGVSAARNAGIKSATGDWIALLDSDDEWLDRKLSHQAELLKNSGLKVCHTQELWVRNGVRVNQMNKHKKAGGHIFEHCLPLCAMSPSSILIEAGVFSEVGLFDENLPACEDYDLWLRITANHEVAYVSEPCITKYGGHEDQLSRAHWGMDRFRVIALAKLLMKDNASVQLSPLQRSAALNMLKKKNTILLNGARKHGNQSLVADCEARVIEFDL